MSTCVHFATRSNEQAAKVQILLEGLGFDARRDLAELETDTDLFTEAAVSAARRFRLTDRERQVLEGLLRGQDRRHLAELLDISAATIKWHIHNIFGKLAVSTSDEAVRLVLSLDRPRWLAAPLRYRNALMRLAEAADDVGRARKGGSPVALDRALNRLHTELTVIRSDAYLDLRADEEAPPEQGEPQRDNQLELPTGTAPDSI